MQTLALLMWASHIKSLKGLNGYKTSFFMVVRAYAEHQMRKNSEPQDKECPCEGGLSVV